MSQFSADKTLRKLTFVLKTIFYTLVFCTLIAFWISTAFSLSDGGIFEENDFESSVYDKECNVAGITLYGFLTTYEFLSDNKDDIMFVSSNVIMEDLETRGSNENIKAVILEIDSHGGVPVAGEEVADALMKIKKPTVALIRNVGASSAYFAASGADVIFASKNSDVGSIGITMSYLDNVQQNEKEGLTYNQISAGKYKDYGSPDKTLTNEERELLQRDIDIMHNNFIFAIAKNRDMSEDTVRLLADGSSMLGEMALSAGLVDKIGGIYDVKEYLKNIIGEEVNICW